MSDKKRGRLFPLAMKNMKNYGWINFKVCFAFAALAFLVCLFTVYNNGLIARKEALASQYTSGNSLYYFWGNKNVRNYVDEHFDVDVHTSYNVVQYKQRIGEVNGIGEPPYPNLEYFELIIGGETRAPDMNEVGDVDHVYGSVFSTNVIGDWDKEEALKSFGRYELVDGKYPSEGEILIGYYAAKAFGITKADYGKDIALRVAGDEDILFERKLCGTVEENYYKVCAHKSIGRGGFFAEEGDPIFEDAENLRYDYWHLAEWPDDVTAEGATRIGIKYVDSVTLYLIVNADRVQKLGSNLYIMIGSGLIIALILTVFTMVDKYVKVFSRTAGILSVSGMENKRLIALFLLQLLLICAVAFPLAAVMTVGGYYIINIVVGAFRSGLAFSITEGMLIETFALGIAVVLATALVFFFLCMFRLARKSVNDMLKAKSV